MDMPVPAPTQGRRASTMAERKLDELCTSLEGALSREQRSPDTEVPLVKEIKAKTDFLRSLLAAEAECHGGARPEHLAEAEARFAVLEATFNNWAKREASAPEPEEVKVGEPEEQTGGSEASASTCSCTDSCQDAAPGGDAVEAREEDGTASNGNDDGEREATGTRGDAASDAVTEESEAMGTLGDDAAAKDAGGRKCEAAAETRRTVQGRWWWRRGAAWCGAAGVVALVAVGLTVELAAVAHQNVNVYVVPT